MVLDEISNDFENVDQIIFPEVSAQCLELGWRVERPEILDPLRDLIEDGLAAAYILSCTAPPRQLVGMPCLDMVEEDFETYFYLTKKGMDFQRSNETP